MARILIDVDQVLADMYPAWCAWYNARYPDDPQAPENWTDWNVNQFCKYGHAVFEALRDPALYDTVEPVPGACEGVAELARKGHELVIITDSTPVSAQAKLAWLERQDLLRHVAGVMPIIYGKRRGASLKRIVTADLLVDDYFENVTHFGGTALLFAQPHNRHCEWPERLRVANWREVLDFVTGYF